MERGRLDRGNYEGSERPALRSVSRTRLQFAIGANQYQPAGVMIDRRDLPEIAPRGGGSGRNEGTDKPGAYRTMFRIFYLSRLAN